MNEKTILIADDDSELVHMLALRCTQLGLRVLRSPDAMHALVGTNRARPDLLLLDVNMPGGNGLAVCEMLSGDATLSSIPVIVRSGVTNEDAIRRCERLRARFIPKGTGFWDRLEPLIRQALQLESVPGTERMASTKVNSAPDKNPRAKILCIDDDREITKIWKLRLERHGVEVLCALNGEQGFQLALEAKPALILLDRQLPDGDGTKVLGRLRSNPETQKVPVILLSGAGIPTAKGKLLETGANASFAKPVDFQELLAEICKFVPLLRPIDRRQIDSRAAEPAHSMASRD